MKRLIFIQNKVLHYRKSFFNNLSSSYDVIVVHSGKASVEEGDKYSEVILPTCKVGPFYIQRGLKSIVEEYNPDFTICMFDIRWLNILSLVLINKSERRFIWWGLDTGSNSLATFLKVKLANLDIPIVFYTQSNLDKFKVLGVDNPKLYVANNSFDVDHRFPCFKFKDKNTILFVGSLDRRKQLDVLIRAFANIKRTMSTDIKLIIVGEGVVREEITILIRELRLDCSIELTGQINDPGILLDYYKRAIVSVSFGQAGLSVLQSMGFGVPFLSKKNAITGGELSNIQHGYNGLLCDDSIESLEYSLQRLTNDVDLARTMGKNAYDYYNENCSIENMANAFVKVFEKEV